MSDYIFFDIIRQSTYPGRDNTSPAPGITVKPVCSGSIKWNINDDLVTEPSENKSLCLGNICVKMGLKNTDHSNIGDSDYVAAQDYGYAFSSYTFSAKGTGISRNYTRVDLSNFKLALKVVDSVTEQIPESPFQITSKICNIGGKLINIGEWFGNFYLEKHRVQYPSLLKSGTDFVGQGAMLGNNNTNTMIANYGNLVKGWEIALSEQGVLDDKTYPLLYKSASHEFSVSYSLCQKNSDVNWDAQIVYEVNLQIYKDTSNKILGGDALIKEADINAASYECFNEQPANVETVLWPDNICKASFAAENTPGSPSTYQDFRIVPRSTGKYVLETFANQPSKCDPYLILMDGLGGGIMRTDDNGAGDGKNSRIEITLNEAYPYRLRVKDANNGAGTCKIILRKADTISEPKSSVLNEKEFSYLNTANWFEFTPTVTDFYTAYAIGYGNVQDAFTVTIYDASYNRLAFATGIGVYVYVDLYLQANQKVYIKVSLPPLQDLMNPVTGTFSVYVNRQNNVKLNSLSNSSEYMYKLDLHQSQFYRFINPKGGTYTLYTARGGDDPYIAVYDEYMQLIAYNDDGGGNLNAKIELRLDSYKSYFIQVRNVGSKLGAGYFYVVLNK